MKLSIKPIVNNLYHATLNSGQLESTAVGVTKDEATKKALEWLKREIKIHYKIEEPIDDILQQEDDYISEDLEDMLTDEEQILSSGEFLNDEIWKGLENEVHELARQVAKIAVKAALKYALTASVGGSCGGLFTGFG